MGYEIEHKYLVTNDSYKSMAIDRIEIVQAYLSRDPERTVRIRVKGNRGYLTIKGITKGDSRLEFEYEIPESDAKEILKLCLNHHLTKTRYIVEYGDHIWEVDEYEGDLYPLVLAEIELTRSEENYSLPPFVGQEVTGDPRYYNSNLMGSNKDSQQ